MVTTGIAAPRMLPWSAGLLVQNTPNPFSLETTIQYTTLVPAEVSLEVFTISGRAVRTLAEHHDSEAGTHVVRWDGRDERGQPVASGVYLYRLTVNGRTTSRTMVLLK